MIQNIKYQIQNINPDILSWADKYIIQLPDILMDDEKISHIIDGLYHQMTVLLLSTDRRLIFKGFDMVDIDVIPYENIISIKLWESVVEIRTEEHTFRLEKADLNFAQEFCNTVNDFLSAQNTETHKELRPSVFELLEQLSHLRDQGILTNDEFTEQKKRLLDQL